MARSLWLMLVLVVVGVGPVRSADETRASPLYSLPADGTWVEFDWKAVGPDNQEYPGVLRISSVGRTDIQGAPHRWIEIKKVWRQGSRPRRQVRKLLVKEEGLGKNRPLLDLVVEAFNQYAVDDPVTRLTPERTRDFISMGIHGPGAVLREIKAKEEVKTPLGTYATHQMTASGKDRERILQYRGWLTDQVPFGCARFEIHDSLNGGPFRLIFQGSTARSGKGARSEVPTPAQ